MPITDHSRRAFWYWRNVSDKAIEGILIGQAVAAAGKEYRADVGRS